MSNITSKDVTEKRISLVYNSDITGFQALDFSRIDELETLVRNAYPEYDSMELYYNGGNNTGIAYIKNNTVFRTVELRYDGSNNVTGIYKIDY